MADLSLMKLMRNFSIQYPQPWLRQLLVIGQLLFIAALAFRASQRQLTLILFLALGMGLVFTLLRWPSLRLIVTCVAGMVVPFTGPSGLNVTVILVSFLLCLWLLDMMLRPHQDRFAASRTIWPLLAFLIIAFISFGIGQLNWLPFAMHAPLGAQIGGLLIVVLSVGIFLLMANQVQNLGLLSKITWVFLAVAALWVIFRSVLPGLGLPRIEFFQPMGSVFYIWVVALAFSQAALNRDLRPGWRLALGTLVLVTFGVLFFFKFADKSGWIPVLFCILTIVCLRSWRIGLALIPIAAIVALVLSTGLVGSEEYSVSTRFDAWSIVIQIAKTNPILGLGFANYYWYTPLYPIRGYAVSFNSHNNYVDIIAETGVVGLVCLLLFFWQVGWLGWRLRKQAPSGFAQAYVYGALGGLAGMVVTGMFGDWVLPFFYNIGLTGFRSSMLGWLFLGGLVSVEQIVLTQKSVAQK